MPRSGIESLETCSACDLTLGKHQLLCTVVSAVMHSWSKAEAPAQSTRAAKCKTDCRQCRPARESPHLWHSNSKVDYCIAGTDCQQSPVGNDPPLAHFHFWCGCCRALQLPTEPALICRAGHALPVQLRAGYHNLHSHQPCTGVMTGGAQSYAGAQICSAYAGHTTDVPVL